MIKERFSDYIKNILSDDEWLFTQSEYNEKDNLEFETRFTLASGELGLRGSHFEGFIQKTLPANYMHGIFDKSEAFQRELCNLPNYNLLKIYYKTNPISPGIGKISDYIRVLDLKKGILVKRYIQEAFDGRKTLIESIQFLSRNNSRLANLRLILRPLNYSGQFEFENIIDSSVTNFMDFPRFRVKHFEVDKIDSFNSGGIYSDIRTRDRKHRITVASKIFCKNSSKIKNKSYGEYAVEFFDISAKENESIIIDKFSTVQNNLTNINTLKVAENVLNKAIEFGFEKEMKLHIRLYENMWKRAFIKIKGDPKLEKAMRFNLFHLMSTPNPKSNKTNIGAKMIHGEEYGGHAFWDTEIFILPFFINIFPEIAKNLVEYRYQMLDGAIENAKLTAYKGARYPWESADDGTEQCPDYTIEPDGTCYVCTVAEQEIHVSADIIYGGYNYYLRTKDKEYYLQFLEILAQITRFYISRLEYNLEIDKYELSNITGPDEWHEFVKNNFYTNFIVFWVLKLANKLFNKDDKAVKIIKEKLKLNQDEIKKFEEIALKIKINNTEGLIEQFDGYFSLKDIEIYEWDNNKMPIMPKEFKNINREETTINKQADIVMAMFLFDDIFDRKTQLINFEYYEKRTLHRSSLSPSVFSLMGMRLGKTKNAYEYLCRSAFVDYDNNQGNTREGMHAASAAGTYQALIYGFAGLEIKKGKIELNPNLPDKWESLEFNIVIENKLNQIKIEKGNISINVETLLEEEDYV